MIYLKGFGALLVQVAIVLLTTVLTCFVVGWCLGWVAVGFRAVAG